VRPHAGKDAEQNKSLGPGQVNRPNNQKFFGSFFQKRTASFLLVSGIQPSKTANAIPAITAENTNAAS
jgi:hypothetical protein